jgi:hypothetical protein
LTRESVIVSHRFCGKASAESERRARDCFHTWLQRLSPLSPNPRHPPLFLSVATGCQLNDVPCSYIFIILLAAFSSASACVAKSDFALLLLRERWAQKVK